MIKKDYIAVNRTSLFDWLVFTGSISLGFLYPSLASFVKSPAFPRWMLAGLLLYATGALLKHLPLYYRLISKGRSPRQIPYLLFLVIGHWIILFIALIFSDAVIESLFTKGPGTNDFEGGVFLVNLCLSALITWVVFRHKKRIKPGEHHSESFLFRRELLADIFLISGVSILSFIFWEKAIMGFLTARPVTAIGDIFFLFFFLGISFILFYLPLRYLFLVEDHTNQQTWKRLLLIFGLILVRSLFYWLK